MRKISHSFWSEFEKYAHLIFFILVPSFLVGMVISVGLNHSLWGDEKYFVATIKWFGENFAFKSITDYDQVTGPLIYVLYAVWGKITSFEIYDLRLLSLIFSAVTLFLIFRLYIAVLLSKSKSLLLIIVLMLNPYMWGLSFFVFTDIPALCFLILFAWGVYYNKPMVQFTAAMLALLSRQYAIYLVLAASLYQLVSLIKGERIQKKIFLAISLSCIPLFIPVLIWGAIAPPLCIKRWYETDNRIFHLDHITTYITFIAAYLFPILFILWRRLLENKILVLISFILSGWYFLFPIQPSYASLANTQYDTVGLLHRGIKYFTGGSLLEGMLLWLLFFIGLVVLINIVYLDIKRFQNGEWDYSHFLTLSIIFFLLLMVFSYQVWEKYLIMILPFILLRLMLIIKSNGTLKDEIAIK